MPPYKHERTQVVRSNKVVRRIPTESNGTAAMDLGHMNVDLKWCMFVWSSKGASKFGLERQANDCHACLFFIFDSISYSRHSEVQRDALRGDTGGSSKPKASKIVAQKAARGFSYHSPSLFLGLLFFRYRTVFSLRFCTYSCFYCR